MWEQSSLEAYNKLLFGCLGGEVAALQQRKAEYDEARSFVQIIFIDKLTN